MTTVELGPPGVVPIPDDNSEKTTAPLGIPSTMEEYDTVRNRTKTGICPTWQRPRRALQPEVSPQDFERRVLDALEYGMPGREIQQHGFAVVLQRRDQQRLVRAKLIARPGLICPLSALALHDPAVAERVDRILNADAIYIDDTSDEWLIGVVKLALRLTGSEINDFLHGWYGAPRHGLSEHSREYHRIGVRLAARYRLGEPSVGVSV